MAGPWSNHRTAASRPRHPRHVHREGRDDESRWSERSEACREGLQRTDGDDYPFASSVKFNIINGDHELVGKVPRIHDGEDSPQEGTSGLIVRCHFTTRCKVPAILQTRYKASDNRTNVFRSVPSAAFRSWTGRLQQRIDVEGESGVEREQGGHIGSACFKGAKGCPVRTASDDKGNEQHPTDT